MFSQAFADYLADRFQAEHVEQSGNVLYLDYVRCAVGPKAGSSWYQISWMPAVNAPLDDQLKIGDTLVYIHKQTRNGLKKCCLHFSDGKVCVLR